MMPRGNYWYSKLEANDPEMKKELSKYMKMYRLIKAEIRQLTLELARNTAQPDQSKACYRALHRIFNEKSLTRSKEAARLMVALGDPNLIRALQRRYPKRNCSGFIDVQPCQRKAEKSDAKKVHGRLVGRMEMSGDVIHTVFSETGVNQDASNCAHEDNSVVKSKDPVIKEPRQAIIDNESIGSTEHQPSLSRPNLGENSLLQINSFLVKEERKTCFDPQDKTKIGTNGTSIGPTDLAVSVNSGILTNTTMSNGYPTFNKKIMELAEEVMTDEKHRVYLRKDNVDLSAQYNIKTRRNSVIEKVGDVKLLGHLSSLCSSPIPKDSLDQTAWNNKPYPRPSSGPAILISDNSLDQKKRVLHLTSLHQRPGAVHLPDGRISIPASLPKMNSTTLINRVNSLHEVSQTSNKSLSHSQKNIGMAPMEMMGSMNPPNDCELPQDIFEDLHVVKQHRRSFFADGNSLVEVQPRSMPTAPTLIATHTSEGKFNVPVDIESNRRAIHVINTMKNALRTH